MSDTKTVLWIEVKETVSRNIGLTIGEHITQEQADDLLTIMDGEFECFSADSKEYADIASWLDGDIMASEGFDNVQIYTREEK